MTERLVFIIQDEDNNYCGSNSFQYDIETKEWDFVYAENLTNGFFLHIIESEALDVLNKLKAFSILLNYKKDFSVKKIDLNKALVEEYILNKDKEKVYPFIHKLVCVMDKATVGVA